MQKTAVIAVFDIGKTNLKLSFVSVEQLSTNIAVLAEAKTKNTSQRHSQYGYAYFDEKAIWDWLVKQFQTFSEQFHVEAISITTHGATAVLLNHDADPLNENNLAFPILDYEYPLTNVDTDYLALRPDFFSTYSPSLPNGLNLGKQLFWLKQNFADQFKQVATVLMYPQYWGWKFSGVLASEATSLGCHTDLWQPDSKTYSELIKLLDLENSFPPLMQAGKKLGTLLPEYAALLGVSKACQIINGIHDSNASFVPYLAGHSESPASSKTVISSGTWTILAELGGNTDCLDAQSDMLANTDYLQRPIPSIRFMGGREWEVLVELQADPNAEGNLLHLPKILNGEHFLLPAFSDQGGPFQRSVGKLVSNQTNASLNSAEQNCLSALYCALMIDYCLDLIQSKGDIHLEGSFVNNPVILEALAQFRFPQPLFYSQETTGTLRGTIEMIGDYALPPINNLAYKMIYDETFIKYKQSWRALVAEHEK